MLRVAVAQAREGMELAQPVFHPRCVGTVLLRTGVTLDEHAVRRLRELEVRDLWIRFPSLDFLTQYVSPEIQSSCAELAGAVGPAFESTMRGSGVEIDFYLFKRCVTDLLERITAAPCASVLVDAAAGIDDPALRHASNVCFLSLLMGLKLDFYLVRERARLTANSARDVSNLGVGALLHDIGMLQLPRDAADLWLRTGDERDTRWREHVTIGHRLVRDQVDASAAAAVLHHHQRYDGAGFPRRPTLAGEPVAVAGSDIHVFARIVAVADVFDRLRYDEGVARLTGATPRSATAMTDHCVKMPTARALRYVREMAGTGALDPIVTKVLCGVVPAFAPGGVVTLSDGREAVVTHVNAEDAMRPRVRIVRDLLRESRSDSPGERIDLSVTPGVHITQAEGFDVTAETNPAGKPATKAA
jgi:HD-GYP domain-containing protein (c-di-GMP phosphodiesterase class II)